MSTFKTVTLYPSTPIEGKDYQRLNLGSRQLNKLARILQEAPEGFHFSGVLDGMTVVIEKRGKAQKPAPVNATPAYKRQEKHH